MIHPAKLFSLVLGMIMIWLVVIVIWLGVINPMIDNKVVFQVGDCIANNKMEKWEYHLRYIKVLDVGKHSYHVDDCKPFFSVGKACSEENLEFIDQGNFKKVECPKEK